MECVRIRADLRLVRGVALVELQLHVVALLDSWHDALADILDVQVKQSPENKHQVNEIGKELNGCATERGQKIFVLHTHTKNICNAGLITREIVVRW